MYFWRRQNCLLRSLKLPMRAYYSFCFLLSIVDFLDPGYLPPIFLSSFGVYHLTAYNSFYYLGDLVSSIQFFKIHILLLKIIFDSFNPTLSDVFPFLFIGNGYFNKESVMTPRQ